MERQKKIYEIIFNFELARTSNLKKSTIPTMPSKRPGRRPKKHPLPTGTRQRLQRILAGHDHMGEMSYSMIDCLNHVRALEGHFLACNRLRMTSLIQSLWIGAEMPTPLQ